MMLHRSEGFWGQDPLLARNAGLSQLLSPMWPEKDRPGLDGLSLECWEGSTAPWSRWRKQIGWFDEHAWTPASSELTELTGCHDRSLSCQHSLMVACISLISACCGISLNNKAYLSTPQICTWNGWTVPTLSDTTMLALEWPSVAVWTFRLRLLSGSALVASPQHVCLRDSTPAPLLFAVKFVRCVKSMPSGNGIVGRQQWRTQDNVSATGLKGW